MNGPEYADEELSTVYLPEGHGQTLTFSPNVTQKHDNEKNLDYLSVKGTEFTISYAVTDNNSMMGFFPAVEEADNITVNCSQSAGVFTFHCVLKSKTASLLYDEYIQVGDIYYSDDTWSRNLIDGKIPIGVVFKTGATGTDDIPGNYGWDPDRRIRGYVVALADASTRKGCWGSGTNNVYLTTSYEEASSLKDKLRTKYYSGYIYTNQLKTQNPNGLYGNAVETSPSKGLWAFKVAVEYHPGNIPAGEPAAPPSSSGWYLPSIRQLVDISSFFWFNLYLQQAGGKPFDNYIAKYWSSSECANTEKYSTTAYMCVIATMRADSEAKTAQCYVRSVLTF